MKRHTLFAVGLAVGLSSPVLAENQSDVTQQLLKKVEELEQKIRVLERKNELADESSAEKAKTIPKIAIGASGLNIQSADTNFVFKIRGYVQVDGREYFDDTSNQNETFLIRRLRPILEGTVFEKFDYRVMLDFPSGASLSAGNNALVQDAYLNARFRPELQLQVGKMKEPVGLERLQSGSNLLFPERSYPTQLLPNRDVGIQLHGNLWEDTLQYQLGAFNGVADGGSGDFDATDDSKDVAARLFAHPFKKSGNEFIEGFGIGAAVTYGSQSGALLRSYASPGQQRIFAYHSGATPATPTVTAAGDHWRFTPQAYWYWRSLGILGEYAISSQELDSTLAGVAAHGTLHHSAWQIAASYFLTGEDNSFKAVTPLKPFKPSEGGWGAFELAARVSQIDFDDDAFPTFASATGSATEATSWALGVNWHLNRHVKASLAYEHTDFDGGTSPLLAEGEDVLFGRVQFGF